MCYSNIPTWVLLRNCLGRLSFVSDFDVKPLSCLSYLTQHNKSPHLGQERFSGMPVVPLKRLTRAHPQ